MLTMARFRGFTVIEIAITLVIFGILLALAAPMYSVWLQNARARDMADSYLSGLMSARVEAIKRGSDIRLEVVNTRGWRIVDSGTGNAIQAQPALEHLGTVSVTTTDTNGGAATAVTFTSLGTLSDVLRNNNSPVMARMDVESQSIDVDDRRQYSILIAPNGSIRWCDRKMLVLEDPRSCQR